ncbi:hypothetical protein LXL04_039209 [Taraxacum kok-saghyz]
METGGSTLFRSSTTTVEGPTAKPNIVAAWREGRGKTENQSKQRDGSEIQERGKTLPIFRSPLVQSIGNIQAALTAVFFTSGARQAENSGA